MVELFAKLDRWPKTCLNCNDLASKSHNVTAENKTTKFFSMELIFVHDVLNQNFPFNFISSKSYIIDYMSIMSIYINKVIIYYMISCYKITKKKCRCWVPPELEQDEMSYGDYT